MEWELNDRRFPRGQWDHLNYGATLAEDWLGLRDSEIEPPWGIDNEMNPGE